MEDIVLDREYKSSLRCLKIGDKVAELPIIQGGMGVGVSRSSLAGAVAAEGGVGVISTAQIGYDEAGFEKDQAGCNLKAIRKHIWKARFGIYRLGFPNREVEEGFVRFLIPYYTRFNKIEAPFEIQKFVQEIERGEPDAFFRRLQSFFADTPYELVKELELHYQNVLFIVFKLVGFYVKAEYHTSQGRIDLVLQTDKYVYVMEFKLNGTAEEALQQINDKQYALPFAADSRKVLKIGVNFSNTTRNIERWVVEEL